MVVLVVALFLIREVILVLFLAIVVSSAFNAPVSFLERRRIPRVLGTIFIFLAVLSVLAFILYTIIPVAFLEIKELTTIIYEAKLPTFGSIDVLYWVQTLERNLGEVTGTVFSGGTSFLNFAAKILNNVVLIITTLIISFYLTVNREGVEKFLRAILPVMQEDRAISLYHRVRKKMGLWLQGQIVLMLIIGAAVFFGLWILGVKYSLILGLLAGLLEIVPIAGPILTGIIVFLIALPQSWILALYTIILFVIIQQLENHLIFPMVMKKTTGISPVVVVVAILAGSKLAGITGIILAVPTAMIFDELLDEWEKKKFHTRGARLEV